MPRHNRRSAPAARRVGSGSTQSTAEFRGEQFTVRTVAGAAAGKAYRCPGCDQLIATGTPHLVVWRYDDLDATDRRHWHRTCWDARDRRGPTR